MGIVFPTITSALKPSHCCSKAITARLDANKKMRGSGPLVFIDIHWIIHPQFGSNRLEILVVVKPQKT